MATNMFALTNDNTKLKIIGLGEVVCTFFFLFSDEIYLEIVSMSLYPVFLGLMTCPLLINFWVSIWGLSVSAFIAFECAIIGQDENVCNSIPYSFLYFQCDNI